MHKRTIEFIIGVTCGAACLAFLLLGYHMAAAIAGLLAFLPLGLSVRDGMGNFGLVTWIFTAGLFGYVLTPPGGHYLLMASLIVLAMLPSTRMVIFRRIGNYAFLYMEHITFVIATALYVLANVIDNTGWMGWAFPAPIVFWGLMMTVGFEASRKELLGLVGNKLGFGVKPGGRAPDFTLTDQEGNKITLSEYKGKRHALLIFVRGDWCPTCHIMLRTYEKNKSKFAEKNIVLLAIGPDPVGVNKEMVHRLGLDYKMLADDKNEAAKSYGMMFLKNNKSQAEFHEGIPLPAAFLVDINGVVAYTTNPKKPGEILKPDTIFPVIEKLKVA